VNLDSTAGWFGPEITKYILPFLVPLSFIWRPSLISRWLLFLIYFRCHTFVFVVHCKPLNIALHGWETFQLSTSNLVSRAKCIENNSPERIYVLWKWKMVVEEGGTRLFCYGTGVWRIPHWWITLKLFELRMTNHLMKFWRIYNLRGREIRWKVVLSSLIVRHMEFHQEAGSSN
jgi:hypothetical protein